MIAYNSAGLDNRSARRKAEEAEKENIISAEEHANIRVRYPVAFYTPPFFARLGFFVLTCICLSFCSGLFALITGLGGANNFAILTLLMAAAVFTALEWFIRSKHHLASGVDDALLYTGAGLAIGACYFIKYDMPPVWQSAIILLVAVVCTARYADRLMALTAMGALLALVFFSALNAGPAGKALMSFILIAVCTIVYFSVNANSKKNPLRHYLPVFKLLKISSLVCLYAAGNYFVVREANHQMSANPYGPSAEIPMAWLFWIFTIGLPVFYLWLGLKKKDRVFLITGLILIAGTVFTVRYYHSVLTAEWAMVLGGLFLLVVAYGSMQYLKTPKSGITAARQGSDPLAGLSQIEALIVDETLSPAAAPVPPGVVFGGGSGGGGGAGGNF